MGITDCEKALEINPSYVKAYLRLGSLYHVKGDTEKSRTNYEKVLELEPNNQTAKNALSENSTNPNNDSTSNAFDPSKFAGNGDMMKNMQELLQNNPEMMQKAQEMMKNMTPEQKANMFKNFQQQ